MIKKIEDYKITWNCRFTNFVNWWHEVVFGLTGGN